MRLQCIIHHGDTLTLLSSARVVYLAFGFAALHPVSPRKVCSVANSLGTPRGVKLLTPMTTIGVN